MDAFCTLNAPAPLLSILEADIVLAVRLPGKILITSEVGVMSRDTRHRAERVRGGGLGMGGGAAVGVRSWMPDYFRVVGLRELALSFKPPALETARTRPAQVLHVGRGAIYNCMNAP
jgi:hypothetical protein